MLGGKTRRRSSVSAVHHKRGGKKTRKASVSAVRTRRAGRRHRGRGMY